MLLIVIFSYNRAMQLDFLLRSIIIRFKLPDYKISVIYHTTDSHKSGYIKIKEKYSSYSNIGFIERQNQIFNIYSYFKTFYSLKNLRLFLTHSFLRNKNSDNFKSLLENLLKTTDCEFVMFNTDDGYFFDDVLIKDNIFDMIKANPSNTSYRLYVGENLIGFPDYIRRENNYLVWNYYEDAPFNHWTYPFAVDGTVYHTKSILNIIKKVAYHNPITLEAYGVQYVKENGLLKTGLGPFTSSLVQTKLNRVSSCSFNPTIHLSTELFNNKFLENYELGLEIPKKIVNVNIVPLKVFLIKENQKLTVYTLDQNGKDVQDALVSKGTKR